MLHKIMKSIHLVGSLFIDAVRGASAYVAKTQDSPVFEIYFVLISNFTFQMVFLRAL